MILSSPQSEGGPAFWSRDFPEPDEPEPAAPRLGTCHCNKYLGLPSAKKEGSLDASFWIKAMVLGALEHQVEQEESKLAFMISRQFVLVVAPKGPEHCRLPAWYLHEIAFATPTATPLPRASLGFSNVSKCRRQTGQKKGSASVVLSKLPPW